MSHRGMYKEFLESGVDGIFTDWLENKLAQSRQREAELRKELIIAKEAIESVIESRRSIEQERDQLRAEKDYLLTKQVLT